MSNLLQYGMALSELKFNTNCKKCIRGEGNAIPGCISNADLTNVRLVVISDYPSYYEDLHKQPFYDNEVERIKKRQEKKKLEVGWPNAGNYIRRKLEAMGLDTYKEVYFTNAIKCKNNSDKTIVPKEASELKPCVIEWLLPELNIISNVKPDVPILLAGKYAFIAFKKFIPGSPFKSSNIKLKQARGKEYRYKYHPLFVTVNPATACTSIPKIESLEVEQKSDLKSVKELSPLIGSPDFHYTNDLALLKKCLLQN